MTEKMTIAEWRHDHKPRKTYANFEHQNQSSVIAVLEFNAPVFPFLEFIFAVPSFSKKTPSQARNLTKEGMRSGVWDLFVPFTRHGKSGLWIEMKYGKNKLTDSQKKFGAHFDAENYLTKVCYSADECLDEIENYLGIKLKRGE